MNTFASFEGKVLLPMHACAEQCVTMMCGASAFTSALKPELFTRSTGAPSQQTAETISHERLLSLKKSSTSFLTSAALVVRGR